MMPKTLLQSRIRICFSLALVAFAGFCCWRFWTSQQPLVSPTSEQIDCSFRDVPLDIKPNGAFVDLVAEFDLAAPLETVQPFWTTPSMGLVLHSLRLWGPDCRFARPIQRPGYPALTAYATDLQFRALVDHSSFEALFHHNPFIPPLLTVGNQGVTITTNSDQANFAYQGQFHADQLLQVLGEIGCPLNHKIRPHGSASDSFTVRDLLVDSTWRFSKWQEPEFTAIAYARWLAPPAAWTNRFGQKYDMNDLANQLIARRIGEGPCLGAHVPMAITSLIRADSSQTLLEPTVSENLRKCLGRISQLLENEQRTDGSWDADWPGWSREAPPESQVYPYGQLLATGHHLEWIALAPPELCPSRETIKKAATFLYQTISSLREPFYLNPYYYPLGTHAVRALALLQNTRPASVLQRSVMTRSGVPPDAQEPKPPVRK